MFILIGRLHNQQYSTTRYVIPVHEYDTYELRSTFILVLIYRNSVRHDLIIVFIYYIT